MKFDETRVHSVLTTIVTEAINDFAQRHPDEQFYGFAFDCNADYGEVLLCLNTEQDLQASAKELKESPPKSFLPKFDKMMEEKYGVKPKPLFHDKTAAEVAEKLRWNPGDWKYQGFYNCSDDPDWAELAEEIAEQIETDEDREAFLRIICRLIPAIKPALERLHRTSDFRVLVIDHDETVETAWQRLAKLESE